MNKNTFLIFLLKLYNKFKLKFITFNYYFYLKRFV